MALERKLVIGIPKGNLNREEQNRGNTKYLLELAGWKLHGYDHKNEKGIPEIIKGDKGVRFVCMKPKQFPILLKEGLLDVAIIGEDIVYEEESKFWIFMNKWLSLKKEKIHADPREDYRPFSEWYADFLKNPGSNNSKVQRLNKWFANFLNSKSRYMPSEQRNNKTINFWKQFARPQKDAKSTIEVLDISKTIEKIIRLGYGKVDVAFGINKEIDKDYVSHIHTKVFGDEKKIVIASAYPNMTFQDIQNNFYYRDSVHMADDGIISGKPLIEIYYFPSKTESLTNSSLFKVIVECIASGESFEKYNLRKKRSILKDSTTCLYSSDQNNMPEWKINKINEIAQKLKAASLEYGKTRQDSIYYKGDKG